MDWQADIVEFCVIGTASSPSFTVQSGSVFVDFVPKSDEDRHRDRSLIVHCTNPQEGGRIASADDIAEKLFLYFAKVRADC